VSNIENEIANLKLSKKQSDALYFLEDDLTTDVLYGGAAGGGKTMLGCIWQIQRRLNMPESRGCIVRHELKQLRESTMVTFYDVARQMGLQPGVHFKLNEKLSLIKFINNSTISLIALNYKPSDPDYTYLGSTEYTDMFMDEAGELPERGASIMRSRIRYKIDDFGTIPKLLMCSNPHDGWLKYRFVKDKNGNPVSLPENMKYIQARLTDNPDKRFAEMYHKQLLGLNSDYDRARLIEGDWDAHPKTGQEYYYAFNYDKHVSDKIEFNKNQAVHLTFDFNSQPYMTMLEIQIELIHGIWYVKVLDEYCLAHPENTTYHVVNAFKKKRFNDIITFYYYGDYTGKNQSTSAISDIRHNYDVVEHLLAAKRNNNSNRVIPNRPVLRRKEFVLDILQERLPIRLLLHPNCRNLIKEMTYMKELPDGTKHVEMTRDEATKKNFEMYGHTTDALEYFLTSCFREYYENQYR
jgi:hypothetical protein